MDVSSEIQALIRRYDRAAPRYTSYPTALRFSAETGQAAHENWLGLVPATESVSLYLHIPFCRTLCFYCGCNTRAMGDHYSPAAQYVDYLKKEIIRVSTLLGRKQKVSNIHFGGGTPTFLQIADMRRLFECLHESFAIGEKAEIAIEIDPRLIKEVEAGELAGLGFNRVSLGVQDFDPAVQKAIGRWQPYESVVEVTRWFRESGIADINFDMMYGLPLQTVASVEDNAQKVAALRPGRMALFGYAHVPWMKKNQKALERYRLPDSVERYAQFMAARALWLSEGYREIGIDHFALPEDSLNRAFETETLGRNFMGYVVGNSGTILGFGASAISAFSQGYLQNESDTKIWQEKVGAEGVAAARGVSLTSEDYRRREIIEKLMCYFRAPLSGFQVSEDLLPFLEDGLIVIEGDILTITEKGRPFARMVCTVFDEYYEGKPQRHARAV